MWSIFEWISFICVSYALLAINSNVLWNSDHLLHSGTKPLMKAVMCCRLSDNEAHFSTFVICNTKKGDRSVSLYEQFTVHPSLLTLSFDPTLKHILFWRCEKVRYMRSDVGAQGKGERLEGNGTVYADPAKSSAFSKLPSHWGRDLQWESGLPLRHTTKIRRTLITACNTTEG